jgi:hypothetical protein
VFGCAGKREFNPLMFSDKRKGEKLNAHLFVHWDRLFSLSQHAFLLGINFILEFDSGKVGTTEVVERD